ncbi:MAG: hypothetical protein A2X77_05920 [Gammaproteobacteria bacterium GWE2_42_36]|nr:MAG: hypothetical protein A2X77_05920 [Gammaproteobacteria bacterium GWE2_42_36]HCU05223.1 hypothetical protein [Coxiellaceae bacterium]
MNKQVLALILTGSLLGGSISAFAATPTTVTLPDPPMNCKQFLLAPVVVDQIREEALGLPESAQYRVMYHADKDYCDLTVSDKENKKTYHFTSESANNFEFDPNDRTFELLLYKTDQLSCENTIEATYEDSTKSFVDAAYDFPLTEGGCSVNKN